MTFLKMTIRFPGVNQDTIQKKYSLKSIHIQKQHKEKYKLPKMTRYYTQYLIAF